MSETETNHATVWTGLSLSQRDTLAAGRAIGKLARSGDLVCLIGELGAGKTVFTRGLAGGMGASEDAVASPTFVLIHEYPGLADRPTLVHVDAYRVSTLDELESIGWDPEAGGGELRDGAVLVVEWADRLAGALGDDRLEVTLEHFGLNERGLTVRALGRWSERAEELRAALDAAITPPAATGPRSRPAAARPCPICGKPVEEAGRFFPFCSDRCKTIDLARWAQGDYKISRPIEQRDLDESD